MRAQTVPCSLKRKVLFYLIIGVSDSKSGDLLSVFILNVKDLVPFKLKVFFIRYIFIRGLLSVIKKALNAEAFKSFFVFCIFEGRLTSLKNAT